MQPKKYQTKNGDRYKVQYYNAEGKRSTKRGFKTKTEARIWYRHYQNEVEYHGFAAKDKLKCQAIIDRWLNIKRQTVVGSSYCQYRNNCKNHISPYFGQMKLVEVTIDDCQDFVDLVAGKLQRFDKIVGSAKAIFKLAVKLKLRHDNPFEYVDKPRVKHTNAPKSFTTDQFQQFKTALADLQAKDYKAFAMLALLAMTGARKGEVMALTWNNIDFENGTIDIEHGVTRDYDDHLTIGTPKNDYSIRTVPIGPAMIVVLKKWRSIQRHQFEINNVQFGEYGELVFASNKGGLLGPNQANKWLRKLENKYGLPTYVTPHGLRHTFTTLILANDVVSPNEAAKLLGHRDATITMSVYNDLHEVTDHHATNFLENM